MLEKYACQRKDTKTSYESTGNPVDPGHYIFIQLATEIASESTQNKPPGTRSEENPQYHYCRSEVAPRGLCCCATNAGENRRERKYRQGICNGEEERRSIEAEKT